MGKKAAEVKKETTPFHIFCTSGDVCVKSHLS